MQEYRFARYGIVGFSPEVKQFLREIAQCLIPHQDEIVDNWIERQWRAWQPPGLSREDLSHAFGRLFRNVLACMRSSDLDICLEDLEEQGRDLATARFPFQALIISVHFLEESYLPILLREKIDHNRELLIAMDEFLHSALAAIATSYFEANRKELLEEAEAGRILQEGLLADIPPRVMDLEIAHVYMSAHERAQVGGDFLDFFRVDEERVAFLIGDLSGHGLEAAADSVMLRSLFRGFMREHCYLSDAMERTNRVVMEELNDDQFATALGIVYTSDGNLRLVNAGHPCPLICSDSCRVVDAEGMALGIFPDAEYGVVETQLPPGGVFVAFTDGLTEAGPAHDQFGEKRVLETVAQAKAAPAKAILGHLIDRALHHEGGTFDDDVAVLVIKRR